MTPEEFYFQNDSCYLKVQYIKEKDAFRIYIRNEMMLTDNEHKGATLIGNMARGLLEIAYVNTPQIYSIGQQATFNDTLAASSEGLTEAQRKVWLSSIDDKVVVN